MFEIKMVSVKKTLKKQLKCFVYYMIKVNFFSEIYDL